MLPWADAPRKKLVLIWRPLPTVTALSDAAGWETVTARVEPPLVGTKPGMLPVTVVAPAASGWNMTPPVVVSVGVLFCWVLITAVWLNPAGVAALSRLPKPLFGVVNVATTDAGAPARRFCSWLSWV